MSSSRRFYRPPNAATCLPEPLEKEVRGEYKKKIDPTYLDQEGRNPLHQLVWLEGDDAAHVLDHIIQAGAGDGVNAPDGSGVRPLNYAARNGAVRCMRVLLGHGARLDEHASSTGDTALMTAAAAGQHRALELLIRAGAAVNLTNHRGRTALHNSVHGGCDQCVRTLLKYGGRINHQDSKGQTPLHLAARYGITSVVRILLKTYPHAKAQLNLQDSYGRTPVHWACTARSNPECLALLLEHAPDTSIFDAEKNSPVLLAMKCNQVVQLEALLRVAARMTTKDGRSTLPVAASLGHLDCTRLLLDSGLDANLSGHLNQTPLILAAFDSHTAVVDLLLSRGANPNSLTCTTPLFAALSCLTESNAKVRHSIIAKLLSEGAEPNHKSARTWYLSPITKHVVSPLSLAFDSGYVSLVRMLLAAGCSVSKAELVAWDGEPLEQGSFDRDSLLAPIRDIASEPMSLSFQIRGVIRNCVAQHRGSSPLTARLRLLPIAPRLISFLLLEELFSEAPERVGIIGAPSGSRNLPASSCMYHPFHDRHTHGMQDMGHFDALEGTHFFNSILR